jgi:hypothetical protein
MPWPTQVNRMAGNQIGPTTTPPHYPTISEEPLPGMNP